MRLLHTADWHLGRLMRGKSRGEEFEAVLGEIVEIAEAERVDALIVAGDIFDSASPPPEAERLLFETLRELIGRRVQVVLLAGNHDNPRRLAAIGRIADLLGVQIADRVRRRDEGGVLTIEANGETARIAAIPWVPDGRVLNAAEVLGLEHENRQTYHDRVADIYRHMCEGMDASTINIVAGHLFVDGALLAAVDGSERRLHIEQAYGVSATSLPSHPHYLALGHIHQPQVLTDAPNGAAAYAGSILQLDFGERGQQKSVRIVEVSPGRPAEHRDVPLTRGRQLVELRGTLDEVVALGHEAGDAHIRAVLEVERPEPGLAQRVRDALPNTVDVRLDYDRSTEDAPAPDLERLSSEELFVRYFNAQHGAAPTPELLGLFSELMEEAEAPA